MSRGDSLLHGHGDPPAGWSLDLVARPVRDGDERLTARWLAVMLVTGAGLGSLNLLVGGVLRDGVYRTGYAATMLLLLLLGVVLAVRRRAGQGMASLLVVLGDAVYVVVALSTTDPLLYSPPLMLLFSCFAAAWFLGPRMLAVHMVLVVLACAGALERSHADPMELAVQVLVNSAVLNLVTVGVFVLRRRVQRLLDHTRTLSSTDALTGLANRRWLVEQAPRLWRQARRDGQRVAALVLDLDHFKQLNDAFGHATGDQVLRVVAAALSATVRPSDVLARTGGEELVVLGLVTDPAEARRLAERLRLSVAGSCPAHQVTASIGVALVRPVDDEDAADGLWRLIDRADGAMYAAKQGGRNRVSMVAGSPVPIPRNSSVGSV